jgi:hypothetical protein
MKASKLEALLTGAGILSITVFSAGVWALPVTEADIERCNQKAAEVSARTAKGSHDTAAQQPGAPSTNPTGGRITDSSQPGMLPGAGNSQGSAQSSTNPTGGRVTDSTQSGSVTIGMAPIGEKDGVYRQAYIACLNEHR